MDINQNKIQDSPWESHSKAHFSIHEIPETTFRNDE